MARLEACRPNLRPRTSAELEHRPASIIAGLSRCGDVSPPPDHLSVGRSTDDGFATFRALWSVDNDRFESPAGSFVWIPRGAAHSFHNTSERPATLLFIVTAEAITLVEEFLTLARNGPPEPDEARALLAQYDTVLA